jgi:hypothetical protein
LSNPALETDQITLVNKSTTSTIEFNSTSMPAITSNVIVTYATGQANQPPIAWRTLIDDNNRTTTIAIDDTRKTNILANVYVYTNEIEIADMTAIGSAPGSVWINNELIYYMKTQLAPTSQYPTRGFISELRRGFGNTSDIPPSLYDTIYYTGDGNTRFFAASSGNDPIAESVYVNGVIQVSSTIDPVNGTYMSTSDNIPANLPAGRYIVFNNGKEPPVGWKNVKIVALNSDITDNNPIHLANSEVIDSSNMVTVPGGYNWEPTPFGLQYSTSNQARFLLQHSGTRS